MLQFAIHDDRGHVTRTVGYLEQRPTIRDTKPHPPSTLQQWMGPALFTSATAESRACSSPR
eukprot:4256734-Amphidinium_carterae.1